MRIIQSLVTLPLAMALLSACDRGAPPPPSVEAGMIPAAQDADGDGILDEWERNGVAYVDPTDGSAKRLDLSALGASPSHKDLILWLASMTSATHTHRPAAATLDKVRNAFARAPVKNGDGVDGIRVIIIESATPVPEDASLGTGTLEHYNWSEFDAIKKGHLPETLHGTAFFGVFAHNVSTHRNSGLAHSIPGRDFIVSLGSFTNGVGTPSAQAGTLMHELGHVLGLRHGGKDDIGYKPNYLSVMNYLFQLDGLGILGAPGTFDYSRFALMLSEEQLNENIGLGAGASLAKYSTLFYCCSTCKRPGERASAASIAASRVDWNCDSQHAAQAVKSDVNRDDREMLLDGADDWNRVIFKPNTSAGIEANVSGTSPGDELTPEQADDLPLFSVANVQARRIGNGILVEWQEVPLERVVAYRIYRAAPGVPPRQIAIVENVDQPTYADTSVTKGSYAYSVTALFAPHADQPAPPSPAPAAAGGQARVITDAGEIMQVQKAAPFATAELRSLGGITPEADVPAPFTSVLRETERSTPATVLVQ